MYVMDKFTVEFYETKHGRRPAEEFLNELDIKMRGKLVMILKVLQEKGMQLREPYSKYLEDGIFAIFVNVNVCTHVSLFTDYQNTYSLIMF